MKILPKLSWHLKYHYDNLSDIFGVLNSPFKSIKLKFYFGDIERGIPYFLPRRMVSFNKSDCINKYNQEIQRFKEKGLEPPQNISPRSYKNYYKFVTTKHFGVNSVYLGWKTKFDNVRYEYSPRLSIVLFKKQFVAYIISNTKKPEGVFDLTEQTYWEAWITYRIKTDKSLSTKERLLQLFEKYSCTWSGDKNSIDYYEYILKNKYKKFYIEYKSKSKYE